MRIAILIAGVLLTMPVQAAEQLTDAQLDRITAGGFTIAARPARLFVNDIGRAGRLFGAFRADRFTIVETPGRLDISGPANVGIFVNDGRQAGRLFGALRADGFTIIDRPGRLDISGPANVGIFVNDGRRAGRLSAVQRIR